MSYNVIKAKSGGVVKAWTEGVVLDEKARRQLENVASMPFIHRWVAAMPDAHWGLGATIGSVIATKHAVIPAAVGVDLGCGMVAAPLNLAADDLPSNLKPIREAIEKAVPHGRTDRGGRNDRGAWHHIPADVARAWQAPGMKDGYRAIVEKYPKLGRGNDVNHLGTLGTGNHFIEICLDETDTVWVMLHSGSRGVGNRLASYFIAAAKKDMERWSINLPDKDLAYIKDGSELFRDYVAAVTWAQNFAALNRSIMLENVVKAVDSGFKKEIRLTGEGAVNCHHNYIAREKHYGDEVIVTRKGAVRARKGDLGIIPGSMGTRSYVVRGKGNPESFDSCSHGAGRMMSRREAKRRITLENHEKATAAVECRKDSEVLDESPAAYKDIDRVMAAQAHLVEIVHTLKQVVCVKG